MNKVLWSSLLVFPAAWSVMLSGPIRPVVAAEPPSLGATEDAIASTSPSLDLNASSQELGQFQSLPEPPAARSAQVQPQPTASTAAGATAIAQASVDRSNSLPSASAAMSQISSGAQRSQPEANGSMAQLTSVTQLSDVQPTDWAYQALQSLVERYGCIVGYPDGTYKGQRALTRYEFAAGLNACLDRISELVASSTADLATKEDLATLQRLQEEFAAELASLRGQVDSLEARVSELEANQFSTTTKLRGETIFSVFDAFGDEVGNNNEIAFASRIRLTLDTSFTGSDRLRARLQFGDFGRFNGLDDDGVNILGNEARLGYDTNTNGSFQLDILSYRFPIGDNLTTTITAGNRADINDLEYVNTISPFQSSGNGAISRFGRYNPAYRSAGAGAGGAITFNFTPDLALQTGYLGAEAPNSTPGAGLFNGDYGLVAQLTFTPFKKRLNLGLTYLNTYTGNNGGFNTGTGTTRSQVDLDEPAITNTYAAELNFAVTDWLQIGGWFSYSAVRVIETGDAQVWNYALTLAFPDLFKEGSLGGIVAGVQPYLGGTTGFEVAGRRGDEEIPIHIEAFYRYRLNDNISITPGVIVLPSPNGDSDNPTAIIGAVRTTFTF